MREIYEEVTAQIIEALENVESGKWECPWSGAYPVNASTGKSYRGLNVLLLMLSATAKGFKGGQWVTFKQAKALGGRVRKGERGTKIVFFRMIETKDSKKKSDDEKEAYPVARYYTVFNTDQCDGLESSVDATEVNPIADIETFIQRLSFKFIETAPILCRAAYAPGIDTIVMPPMSVFRSSEDYYATFFHEIAHWTGHTSRLARDLSGRFGDESYAAEELIAEFASAFLSARFGIASIVKHTSYIASWKELLTSDPFALATCAKQATNAVDFLLGEEVGHAS